MFCTKLDALRASQVALVVKNLSANAGDLRDIGLIPGWERFPGGEYGNPLHCSYLENPMNGQRSLAGYSAKSQTGLKQLSTRARTDRKQFKLFLRNKNMSLKSRKMVLFTHP